MRFEFGFMLFEPSTTFDSVRQDLGFLRRIVGDGATAATFCRMMPYDGTPIKDELLRTGRLRGDVCNPDYEFLDPRLTEFCNTLGKWMHVTGWIHGFEALSPQLNLACSEAALMERLFPTIPGLAEYKASLREIIRDSNDLLFRVVEDLSYEYTDGRKCQWSAARLQTSCEGFLARFLNERNTFIYQNQGTLLGARGRAAQPHGVPA